MSNQTQFVNRLIFLTGMRMSEAFQAFYDLPESDQSNPVHAANRAAERFYKLNF